MSVWRLESQELTETDRGNEWALLSGLHKDCGGWDFFVFGGVGQL